ncbi:MAG: hypothetical protein ACPGQP_02725 [Nitrosopumilus sp.]
MKTIDEIIQKNVNHSKKILEELGGYKKYLEFMNDKPNNNSLLKKELLFMNEEMSSIGVMTVEEFDDPKSRQKFFDEYDSSFVIGLCKDESEK